VRGGRAQYAIRKGLAKSARAEIDVNINCHRRFDHVFPILGGAIECRSRGGILLQLLRRAQNDDQIGRLRRLTADKFIELEVIDLSQTQFP